MVPALSTHSDLHSPNRYLKPLSYWFVIVVKFSFEVYVFWVSEEERARWHLCVNIG